MKYKKKIFLFFTYLSSKNLDLTDREEVAAALVGIFDYHSLLQLLISSAIERELKKESETSLLQNSMAIRFASFYLTFSASEFLKLALQGCIISLSLTPDHSIYEVNKIFLEF